MLPQGLQPLAGYKQFILYKLERRENGKVDKVPHSPYTLEMHDAHDPSHWTDVENAFLLAESLGEGWGAGFVLTDGDPFYCLDLDHCRTESGWSETAASVADSLPGAAIEVSQSNESLHFWGMSAPLEHRTRPHPNAKCPWPGVELYTRRRFIALTGNVIAGNAATLADLRPIVDAWFTPEARNVIDVDEWNLKPVEAWRGPADDDDLIRRALLSQSANAVWGHGVTFANLWHGDADALARRWPSDAGKATAWNESQADAALAAHLAFWTGRHHQRIAELMYRSALVRPKWEREDYLLRTIRLACSAGKDVLQDAPVLAPLEAPPFMPDPPLPSVASVPLADAFQAEGSAPIEPPSEGGTPVSTFKTGRTSLGADEQVGYFRGCVYVRRPNRVYVPGAPYTLDRQQFDATYGGQTFLGAEGRPTKSPWEAFTQSSCVNFPRVDDEDFNPAHAAGRVYRGMEGEWVVNTYLAAEIEAREGNVDLWWQHLGNLFPVQTDRDAFMAWVCALVRHPGRKFPWSPILISGEGTGKTITYDAIRAAMGQRYTRSVRGSSLTSRFNDWIGKTLLCVVEDFRLPKATERDDLLEKLKEMVGGGQRIESEGKGQHASNVKNQCNFLFSANRLDVLRLDENSRRWAPFVINLWNEGQLRCKGMDARYFKTLKDWFDMPSTWSALRHLFVTWPIPDHLNPTTYCTRAPQTTTSAEMYAANKDPATECVEEAVRAGLWGMRDGWASIDTVKAILEKERLIITTHSAGKLLERIGYIPHPSLPGGWTANAVPPFNRKIKLFMHKMHKDCHSNLMPADVVKLYTNAQESAFDFTPIFSSSMTAGMLQ
jgi:hypothetical protein